jgi:hypothetical protein
VGNWLIYVVRFSTLASEVCEFARDQMFPASSTEKVLTSQMASGGGKLEQPMQNAVGNAQDSVNAALDYLGRVAADVSCRS